MRQNMNLPSFELGFWPIVDVLATVAVSYVTFLWLTKEHAPAVDFDVEAPDLSSVDSEPLERSSIQVNHRLLFSSIAHIGLGKRLILFNRSPDRRSFNAIALQPESYSVE